MRESVASRMVGTVDFGIVQRMTAPRQGDLFGNDGPDPSDDDFETPVYYPDPDKVREELHRILGEARAAKTIPWDANRTALYPFCSPIGRSSRSWASTQVGFWSKSGHAWTARPSRILTQADIE
jgi:hypothetical protein